MNVAKTVPRNHVYQGHLRNGRHRPRTKPGRVQGARPFRSPQTMSEITVADLFAIQCIDYPDLVRFRPGYRFVNRLAARAICAAAWRCFYASGVWPWVWVWVPQARGIVESCRADIGRTLRGLATAHNKR